MWNIFFVLLFLSHKITALDMNYHSNPTKVTNIKKIDGESYKIFFNNNSTLKSVLEQQFPPEKFFEDYFFIFSGKRLWPDIRISYFNVDDTDSVLMVPTNPAKKQLRNDTNMFEEGMDQAKDFIYFYSHQNDGTDLSDIRKKVFFILNKMIADFSNTHRSIVDNFASHEKEELLRLPNEDSAHPLHMVALGLKLALLLDDNRSKYPHYLKLMEFSKCEINELLSALNDATKKDHSYVIPLYTEDGLFGVHTGVYILKEGYYPIGFGNNTARVHNNLFDGDKLQTIFHDYGHYSSSEALLKNNPKLRELYSNIYNNIVTQEERFRKSDIFVLFLLMHAFPTNIYQIKNTEALLDDFALRFYLSESSSRTVFFAPEADEEYVVFKMLEDSIDLIPLLRECGHDKLHGLSGQPTDDQYINAAFKLNEQIFSALSFDVDEFIERHAHYLPWMLKE